MDSDRSAKRRCISPMISRSPRVVTPPSNDAVESISLHEKSVFASRTQELLDRAASILAKEAAAVANVATLYQSDEQARAGLADAVEAVVQAQCAGGKLIICAVGKSAYIAMKTTATCKSLGIAASFLHACEAVHGDLGDVRPNDVLMLLSFSGRTPELLNVLAHIPPQTRIMAMSSHTVPWDCPLLSTRTDGILLPTPIPEKEESAFGVAAPTLSTTVAIAVADMLALTVADRMHDSQTKAVFQKNHPGGAIGMSHIEAQKLRREGVDFTAIELPSPSISGSDTG